MATFSVILSNIKESWLHIPYTLKHIWWVNKVSWRYFRRLYPVHDLDKIVLYMFLPFVGTNKVSKWHRGWSCHHDNAMFKYRRDYIEMVCDWESARFTKPDKSLNATDTCRKYYPHLYSVLVPLLKVVNG